jgi:hypothetical protein
MSQLDSARALASAVFTALLMIILLSATRTTYRLAPATEPAGGGYALAACETRTATVTPRPEPPRACPWPNSESQPLAQPLPQSRSQYWPHDTWPDRPGIPVLGSAVATPGHALLGELPD